MSKTQQSSNNFLKSSWDDWYVIVAYFVIIGIVIATAQHWLIQKYSNRTIPYWRAFTFIGWIIAGLVWWQFRYVYPKTDMERQLLYCGYIAIPTLFQALPFNKALKGGWIWVGATILAVLLAAFIRDTKIGYGTLSNFYGTILAGFILSLTTAIIFLRQQAQYRETQSTIEEVGSS